MNDILSLHNLLLTIGGPNVYHQPPGTLKYPCIKYEINTIANKHANDMVYTQNKCYLITVMSKDPDCEIVDKISKLPKCKFDRIFTQDNIHHTTFELYY